MQAQTYNVITQSDLQYAEHDGVKLTGDLYLPEGREKASVLIAAHGGGWQVGSPASRTVVVPGSGHFWASDPIEEPGSYGAQAAPQMLRFLRAAFQ